MPISPVRLEIESYYVREFHVATNTDYDFDKPSTGEVGVDYNVYSHPEDSSRFQVVMTISISSEDEQRADNEPYTLVLVLGGFFRFKEGTSDETQQQMIFSNAVPMMYGIARGFVGQVTATTLNGPVMLPAFNFVELAKRKAEQAAKEEAHSVDEPSGTTKKVAPDQSI